MATVMVASAFTLPLSEDGTVTRVLPTWLAMHLRDPRLSFCRVDDRLMGSSGVTAPRVGVEEGLPCRRSRSRQIRSSTSPNGSAMLASPAAAMTNPA